MFRLTRLTRQLFGHHFPKVGAIGYIILSHHRWFGPQYFGGKPRRCQVVAFPQVVHFQHLITVQFLDTGEIRNFAHQYFEEIPT